MYGYCIYLTHGQAIEGEIEDVTEIAKLPGLANAKTPVTFVDTEGCTVINLKHVMCVSWWGIEPKCAPGF